MVLLWIQTVLGREGLGLGWLLPRGWLQMVSLWQWQQQMVSWNLWQRLAGVWLGKALLWVWEAFVWLD